jgi:hypothetical protein
VIRQARVELRLLWHGFVLPVLVVLCALLALANVANAVGAVHADYAQFEHTRSEYAANHLDFQHDLHTSLKSGESAIVGGSGGQDGSGDQSGIITNTARYDYDTLATSLVELSPASSVSETLKFFGFLLYPALFFLLGLWMATGQRRYRLEKVALVRAGTAGTTAGRHLALLAAAAVVVGATIIAEWVGRSVAQSMVLGDPALRGFAPLTPIPQHSPLAQWAVMLLVTAFFGAAGIAIGAFAGVFAAPSIAFLIIDYVVPVLGQGDPRDWFLVLGYAVFNYSDSFQLATPVPIAVSVAAMVAAVSALVFIVLGYLGIRIRNPRAT